MNPVRKNCQYAFVCLCDDIAEKHRRVSGNTVSWFLRFFVRDSSAVFAFFPYIRRPIPTRCVMVRPTNPLITRRFRFTKRFAEFELRCEPTTFRHLTNVRRPSRHSRIIEKTRDCRSLATKRINGRINRHFRIYSI